jgi:NitT/TauT family transport system substrate-binding protein
MEAAMKRFLLFILVALVISACAPAQQTPSELTPVDVCFTASSGNQAVGFYALEKGYFEKYGLQVNLVQVVGGPKGVATMVSGDVQICQIAGSAVVNAVAAEQDLVLVAGLYNTFPSVLFVQPGINSIDDLRGKTIGVSATGTASEVATRLLLQEVGLDPDKDVILLNMGEESERVLAMKAGQIDAVSVTSPFTHILAESGYLALLDMTDVNIPFAHTAVATSRKFIAENRPVVLAFMKAIIEASHAMKNDPEGAKEVLAEFTGLDMVENAADLEDTYRNVILAHLQDVPYPSLEALQTLMTVAEQTNPSVANLTPEQLVDMSIVRELEESGFINSVLK